MFTVKVIRTGIYIESGIESNLSNQDVFNIYFENDPENEIVINEYTYGDYIEALNVFKSLKDVVYSLYSEIDNNLYLQFVVLSKHEQDDFFGYESTIESAFGELNAAV